MKTDLLDLRNVDCMEMMRDFPDKHFDLAIVDPPYGINAATKSFMRQGKQTGKSMAVSGVKYKESQWDSNTPDSAYFGELRRVSKNQIIWGGNYFGLPASSCWIVWDKVTGDNLYADCELAWTSFGTAVRKFMFQWKGMLQGNMSEKEDRIHPTQKPVALYRWLLERYAKPGQRILDTHLGSGSHAIACHYAGCHLTASELDPDYFAAACERIERETAQLTMF